MRIHDIEKRDIDYDDWILNILILEEEKDYYRAERKKCYQLIRRTATAAIEPNAEYCSLSWDTFMCWPVTGAGSIISQQCPNFMGLNPTQNVTRQCFLNGTWQWAIYEPCFTPYQTDGDFEFHANKPNVEAGSYAGILKIYTTGYTITIIALVIALGIFTYFRSLRCLRNTIHCNLLFSLLLSSVMWLVLLNTLATSNKFLQNYPTLCQALVTITYHFHSVQFYWMFVEGLYLVTIIVWTYSAVSIRLWYYLVIGWVVPVIPTVIWVVKKSYNKGALCFLSVDTNDDFILHGPVYALLSINFIFGIAIIRVLVTKLKASNTLETNQLRKAAKATVVLIPLLGINYVIFTVQNLDIKGTKIVFKYMNTVLQSFQGFIVAVIYCFLNGEVQSLIRKRLNAFKENRMFSHYNKSSVFDSHAHTSSYAMATPAINDKAGSSVAGGASSVHDEKASTASQWGQSDSVPGEEELRRSVSTAI